MARLARTSEFAKKPYTGSTRGNLVPARVSCADFSPSAPVEEAVLFELTARPRLEGRTESATIVGRSGAARSPNAAHSTNGSVLTPTSSPPPCEAGRAGNDAGA
jgi:hypothetical protein